MAYDFVPSTVAATPVCSGAPTASERILIVGDSWTSGGKLNAAYAGSGAAVCSVSYSGKTTAEILASMRQDAEQPASIGTALGRPTVAVAIVGVNDVMQQRGAQNYAASVRALVDHLRPIADRVVVLELPWTDSDAWQAPLQSKAKAALYACLFDACSRNVTQAYRAAVSARIEREAILPYDGFASAYAVADFEPDGIHLRPERSSELGRYIAKALLVPPTP